MQASPAQVSRAGNVSLVQHFVIYTTTLIDGRSRDFLEDLLHGAGEDTVK